MMGSSVGLLFLILSLSLGVVESQQPKLTGLYAMSTWTKQMRNIPAAARLPFSIFPNVEPEVTTPRQTTAMDKMMTLLKKRPCGPTAWEFRTIDGRCNNCQWPSFGASNTGQLLHKARQSSAPTYRSESAEPSCYI